MLKPTLQLRLGQQLTMTPQLQQAIRLLQLPTIELQAHIRELLESNVMLEQDEDTESSAYEPLSGAETAPEIAAPLPEARSKSSMTAGRTIDPQARVKTRGAAATTIGSRSSPTRPARRCAITCSGSSNSRTWVPANWRSVAA